MDWKKVIMFKKIISIIIMQAFLITVAVYPEPALRVQTGEIMFAVMKSPLSQGLNSSMATMVCQ